MSGTDDVVDAKFNVIPIFKGAKKDYIEWYRSFMAIADMKDCKAADRAIKQNKVAMAFLVAARFGL
jgi:hypothetical protein